MPTAKESIPTSTNSPRSKDYYDNWFRQNYPNELSISNEAEEKHTRFLMTAVTSICSDAWNNRHNLPYRSTITFDLLSSRPRNSLVNDATRLFYKVGSVLNATGVITKISHYIVSETKEGDSTAYIMNVDTEILRVMEEFLNM